MQQITIESSRFGTTIYNVERCIVKIVCNDNEVCTFYNADKMSVYENCADAKRDYMIELGTATLYNVFRIEVIAAKTTDVTYVYLYV